MRWWLGSVLGANVTIAVNWGIAAVVYLFIGGLIARLTRPDPPVPHSGG